MRGGSYDDRYEEERDRQREREREREREEHEREEEARKRYYERRAQGEGEEPLEYLEYWAEYAASADEPKTRERYYRWVDHHWHIGRLRAIRDERERHLW
jgi:hypothetical protein